MLGAYLLSFSNSFQNLAPKNRRQFYITNHELFLNHPNHFYTFSLLHICIGNPALHFILPHISFHLQIGQSIGARLFQHNRLNFPKCGKIGNWDRELLEKSFFNLAIKSGLRVGFGNSWRCCLESFCASLEACLSRDAEVHFIREDFSLGASRRTYILWWGAATSARKSATNTILQEFDVLLLISLLKVIYRHTLCNELQDGNINNH
jgi:hypothetical protein